MTTDADASSRSRRQKAPNFAPGEEHLYSNTGYFLLSVIVRRASGQSLREFAQERIFGPLGMRHTQYNESHTRIIPNRATGYCEAEGGGFGIDMSDWEQNGDGGGPDDGRGSAALGRELLRAEGRRPALIDAMLEGRRPQQRQEAPVRVGALRRRPIAACRRSRTAAPGPGTARSCMRFPKQHFSVACLCNLAAGQSEPARSRRSPTSISATLMKPVEPRRRPRSPRRRRPVEALGRGAPRLCGRLSRATSPDSRHARGPPGGGSKGKSGATGDPRSSRPGRAASAIDGTLGRSRATSRSSSAAAGRPPEAARRRYDGRRRARDRDVYEPVDALDAEPPRELESLAGRYESGEVDTTWTPGVEDGKLYIRHRGLPDEPLRPTVDGHVRARRDDPRRSRKDSAGRSTGFTLDEGRVRGLAFRKLRILLEKSLRPDDGGRRIASQRSSRGAPADRRRIRSWRSGAVRAQETAVPGGVPGLEGRPAPGSPTTSRRRGIFVRSARLPEPGDAS